MQSVGGERRGGGRVELNLISPNFHFIPSYCFSRPQPLSSPPLQVYTETLYTLSLSTSCKPSRGTPLRALALASDSPTPSSSSSTSLHPSLHPLSHRLSPISSSSISYYGYRLRTSHLPSRFVVFLATSPSLLPLRARKLTLHLSVFCRESSSRQVVPNAVDEGKEQDRQGSHKSRTDETHKDV